MNAEEKNRLGGLQMKIAQWSQNNFGRYKPSAVDSRICLDSAGCILGITEELGELETAVFSFEGVGKDGFPDRDFLDILETVHSNSHEHVSRQNLLTAEQLASVHEIQDAMGDTLTYLADFLARENLALVPIWEKAELAFRSLWNRQNLRWENFHGEPEDFPSPGQIISRLSHITLKRHQGIRDWDKQKKYVDGIREACFNLIRLLLGISQAWGTVPAPFGSWNLLTIFETTVEKVVMKRNWNQNPQAGTPHLTPPASPDTAAGEDLRERLQTSTQKPAEET